LGSVPLADLRIVAWSRLWREPLTALSGDRFAPKTVPEKTTQSFPIFRLKNTESKLHEAAHSAIVSVESDGDRDMIYTRHALRRMRQRGVRQDFLDLLLANADREIDVGGGSTMYRVSRQAAAAMRCDDRLARFGAILSHDGALITVMPIDRRRSRLGRRRIDPRSGPRRPALRLAGREIQ
jgi:hypothetical protein